jgi:molybdenum cofactor biosynthesis enzyme MoaA
MSVILQIEPTRECNLNCKTCVRKDGDYHGNISIEIYRSILVNTEPCLFDWVKLQGLGEPFMYPDIAQLVDIAKFYGYKKVMTITNGWFPIVGNFDKVIFSINKLIPNSIPIKNLLDAKKRGYNVRINCVLSDQSDNEIKELKFFADYYDIPLDITPMEVWYGCDHWKYDSYHDTVLDVYKRFGLRCEHRLNNCEWSITSLYYDYMGRLHPCCIRMTDEYIISDLESYDFTNCCKECPL